MAKGLAKRDPTLGPLEVVAGGTVAICDEHQAAEIRDGARFMVALYVGGMGSKDQNFYNNLFCQYGYEEEARRIQDLYLAGRKDEAMAAVPQDFLDATAMVGDEGRVRERVEAYAAAGVTRLQLSPAGGDPCPRSRRSSPGLAEMLARWPASL